MMKMIGLGILGVIVALIGLGFVLPDHRTVERRITINAAPETVFSYIGRFEAWNSWSPWATYDPEMTQIIAGEGLGQTLNWQSDHPKVGHGRQTITTFEPNRQLITELDFGEMGGGQGIFILTPTPSGGTEVSWTMDTHMRDGVPLYMKPMATYFGFFIDGAVGPDFELGLRRLKAAAEANR